MAAVKGVLGSLTLISAFEFSAPFLSTSSRNAIIGDRSAVCWSCGGNTKILTDKALEMADLFNAHLPLSKGERIAAPYLSAGSAGLNCIMDDTPNQAIVEACRFLNYGGSVLSFTKEHETALTIAMVALTAGIAWRSYFKYERKEIETENKLVEKLTERYLHAADHLTGKRVAVGNTEEELTAVQGLAKEILTNRHAVEAELAALKLPSFTTAKVRELTEPLFAAAKQAAL